MKAALTLLLLGSSARGAPSLPPVFGDRMVLQREAAVPVWGRAEPGERIVVRLAGQTRVAKADPLGRWRVELDSMPAGGPLELVVEGKTTRRFVDVLVGEVWIGSGQSNMVWPLRLSRGGEKEIARARDPQLRLMENGWLPCEPGTVRNFSAELYYFGRELRRRLGVPVGLIPRAVSGTAAAEWMGPGRLPVGKLYGQLIRPFMPFRIRGVVWDQGESGSGVDGMPLDEARALLVQSWRRAWGQGDFPFVFVQMPKGGAWDGRGPVPRLPPSPPPEYEHNMHSDQRSRLTLALPNTALTPALDLEEGLHPLDKNSYGTRLALSALKLAYGLPVVASGPTLARLSRRKRELRVAFSSVGRGLEARGGPLQGFSIAGADRKFVWAVARIDGETVVLTSATVVRPAYARYAWGDRPRWANLFNRDGFAAYSFDAALPDAGQPDAEDDGQARPTARAGE